MADILNLLFFGREVSAEIERNLVCLQAGGETHRLKDMSSPLAAVLFPAPRHKCALHSMDNLDFISLYSQNLKKKKTKQNRDHLSLLPGHT